MSIMDLALIVMIVQLIICVVISIFYMRERIRNEKIKIRKRKAIAYDKFSNPIYKNSIVNFRNQKCRISFDDNLLFFFIDPHYNSNGYKLETKIPFNVYTAKECEVLDK